MFRGIKHKWRSADAAALIESVLEEMASLGTFDGNAQQMGHKIIKGASDLRPELFDGRNGHFPHRIAFAAASLAMTAERAPKDGQVFPIVMIALGMLLQAAGAGAATLPFSPQDLTLLETAAATFEQLSEGEEDLLNT
jgi:hypothetical protein